MKRTCDAELVVASGRQGGDLGNPGLFHGRGFSWRWQKFDGLHNKPRRQLQQK
jgi:hypothetical protein